MTRLAQAHQIALIPLEVGSLTQLDLVVNLCSELAAVLAEWVPSQEAEPESLPSLVISPSMSTASAAVEGSLSTVAATMPFAVPAPYQRWTSWLTAWLDGHRWSGNPSELHTAPIVLVRYLKGAVEDTGATP